MANQPPRFAKLKVRIFPNQPPQLAEGDLALGNSTVTSTTGISLFVGTKARKNVEILDKTDGQSIYSSGSSDPYLYNVTEEVVSQKGSVVNPRATTIIGADPGAAIITKLKEDYGNSAMVVYGTMIVYGHDDDSLSAISITSNKVRTNHTDSITLSAYSVSSSFQVITPTVSASDNVFINSKGVASLFTATANLSALNQGAAASAAANATATGNILNGTEVFYGTNTFNDTISAQSIYAYTNVFVNDDKGVDSLFTATGNINTTFEASTANLNEIQSSLVTATGNILDGTETFTNTITFDTITAGTLSASHYFVKSITAENITSTGEKLSLKGSLTITGDTLDPVEIYSLKILAPGESTSADKPALIVLTGGNVGIGVSVPGDRGIVEDSFGARFTVNGSLSAGSITSQAVSAFSLTSQNSNFSSLTADSITANSMTARSTSAFVITADTLFSTSLTATSITSISISSESISAASISGALIEIEAFEEDANGDLMPINSSSLNNYIWALNSDGDLILRANYFSYPDWEVFVIANSTTTEQLESVVFG
tara:strand:- start:455 stop:2095 length:1641 start_codon:yes stop_codon:yes gene_type:complete